MNSYSATELTAQDQQIVSGGISRSIAPNNQSISAVGFNMGFPREYAFTTSDVSAPMRYITFAANEDGGMFSTF